MKISFLAAMAVMPLCSLAEVPTDQDNIPVSIPLHPGVIADRNNITDVELIGDNNQAFVDPCPHTYRIRRQWDKLYPEEQKAFLAALQQLKDHDGSGGLPNYDQIAYVHWNISRMRYTNQIHNGHPTRDNTNLFFTWHRWYIYQFETALRSVSGNCDLTLPYWASEFDGPEEKVEPVGDPKSNKRIPPIMTHDAFGSPEGIHIVGNCNSDEGEGCDVTDGIARCDNWPIPEKFGGCVKRKFNWSLPGIVMVKNTITATRGWMEEFDIQEFLRNLERVPHNMPQVYIGGTMETDFSSYDPVFWLHHCNVDKWVSLFQNYKGHDKIKSANAYYPVHGPEKMDSELFFYDHDFGSTTSMFFAKSSRGYMFPTPRELLLNDNLVKVVYAEDEMAKKFMELLKSDKESSNDFYPNPYWFTLPHTNNFADQDENTWDNPALEVLWDGFIENGLSAIDALDALEKEICGEDNPIMVPQHWIDMNHMDAEDFRCHNVNEGGSGGRPGKQPGSKTGKVGKGGKGGKGRKGNRK